VGAEALLSIALIYRLICSNIIVIRASLNAIIDDIDVNEVSTSAFK
jgi:hypothetical protein